MAQDVCDSSIEAVGQLTGYSREDILGKGRWRGVWDARIIAHALAADQHVGLEETGRQFCRHHSTIYHAVGRFRERVVTDKRFAMLAGRCMATFNERLDTKLERRMNGQDDQPGGSGPSSGSEAI